MQGGPVVGGFCCVWPLYNEVHFIPNLYLTYILSLKVYFMMVYITVVFIRKYGRAACINV